MSGDVRDWFSFFFSLLEIFSEFVLFYLFVFLAVLYK